MNEVERQHQSNGTSNFGIVKTFTWTLIIIFIIALFGAIARSGGNVRPGEFFIYVLLSAMWVGMAEIVLGLLLVVINALIRKSIMSGLCLVFNGLLLLLISFSTCKYVLYHA